MVPEVVALARAMRAGGARVGTGEVEAAARALGAVGASRDDAYLGLRAVMCSRREDLAIFDAAFNEVFAGAGAGGDTPPFEMPPGVELALPRVAEPGAEPSPGREPSEVRPAAWSDIELLIDKDFSEYTDDERARVRAVVQQLARRGPMRRSRRLRAARLRGVRPDLQRTLRASLRWGGEPLERRWREYRHAAVATHRRVEVFAFGTRLTRLTRELGVRDPDLALARAAEAVDDWSGGTRIGHSLGVLNREYGRRLGRGAMVVILSDGWDRGEPELLADEMARLRRSAHRVVWLNPLKAAPDYEPLARGMAAALPHTDHFLAGNSLASLAELATILEETR
jgi:uncharacterized protein with von Willebrand factor type A (vWA) domain